MVRPTRRADVVSVHTSLEAFYNELQHADPLHETRHVSYLYTIVCFHFYYL